jgi:hypothetical protein
MGAIKIAALNYFALSFDWFIRMFAAKTTLRALAHGSKNDDVSDRLTQRIWHYQFVNIVRVVVRIH